MNILGKVLGRVRSFLWWLVTFQWLTADTYHKVICSTASIVLTCVAVNIAYQVFVVQWGNAERAQKELDLKITTVKELAKTIEEHQRTIADQQQKLDRQQKRFDESEADRQTKNEMTTAALKEGAAANGRTAALLLRIANSSMRTTDGMQLASITAAELHEMQTIGFSEMAFNMLQNVIAIQSESPAISEDQKALLNGLGGIAMTHNEIMCLVKGNLKDFADAKNKLVAEKAKALANPDEVVQAEVIVKYQNELVLASQRTTAKLTADLVEPTERIKKFQEAADKAVKRIHEKGKK
jgi:uncharacterized coiled-coil protein SlyX